MLKTLITIVCFFGVTISAFSESGTLEIYSCVSPNGTVARRVFTDEHKRLTRTIYYRGKETPKDENDLFPFEIRLYSYDGNGREEWMGVYSPDLILQSALETVYDVEGQLQTRQWRSADGIVRYKIQYEDGRSVSHLYFDDTGTHLIKVQGRIPDGINPSSIQIIK